MANYYEETRINPDKFVPVTSRYMESTVAYYTERRLLTFETYKRQETKPTDTDKFMVVSKGYEFRPDLVSQQAYGVPDFWWRVMEANNISDIYDFKAGINIRVPEVLLQ